MAIKEIVTWPHPSLNEASKKVTDFGEELTALLDDMIETMFATGGIGIAAPQIGVNKRVFCIAREAAEQINEWSATLRSYRNSYVFVNPEVIRLHPETERQFEGCLSLPHINVAVPRNKDVVIEAQNPQGEKFSLCAYGLFCRAILHEYDHLLGITMLDRVVTLPADLGLKRLNEWWSKRNDG